MFILLNFWVFRQEQEGLRIQKAVSQLLKEEEAFDQRVAEEGMPPFLSWERQSKP